MPAGQVRIEDLLDRGLCFARAVARRRTAVDVGARITVEALDDVRTERLLDRDQRTEGDHLSGGVARLERKNVVHLRTERRIRLRHHTVSTAKSVEVIDIHRAQVDLQRLEHVGHLHALALGLEAIDVDVELRNVDLIAGEDTRETRVLVRLAERVLHGRIQRFGAAVLAVLDVELEAAEHAEPDHGRRREHRDVRVLDLRELRVQRAGNRAGRELLRPCARRSP